MAGVTIGQYRVTGTIGRGGMGVVYAAEHALLGRPAAIKILQPDLSRRQEVVTRFFNEARAATAIRHPGIVEVYDFGWTPEGAAYLVMERLEGETLAHRMAHGRLTWPAALGIARQIAGALGAAHAKGIIHRDLKPENVFLVPDPEVPGGERIKLLDFGIAKLASDVSATAATVTQAGAVMGTPTYMAPEQCRGVAVDHRADLYALGCVLYELCAGRPPYVGEGSGDVLAAHIHLPVPSLAAAVADVPAALEQLLQRLLAKAPGDRVQTADELVRAIDAVAVECAGMGTGAFRAIRHQSHPTMTTLSGAAATKTRMWRPGGRRRWPLVVFTAALTVATAVLIATVFRREDAPAAARASEPIAATAPDAAPLPSGGELPGPQPPVHADEPAGSAAAAPVPVPPPPARDGSVAQRAVAAPDPAGHRADSAAANPVAALPESAPSTEPAAAAETAVEVAAEAVAEVAADAEVAAEVPARLVDIAVETTPPGAQVVVDGTVVGITPFHGQLPRRARDVKLAVRLAGYADRVITAPGSHAIRERLTLVRSPASPPRTAKPDRDKSVNPF